MKSKYLVKQHYVVGNKYKWISVGLNLVKCNIALCIVVKHIHEKQVNIYYKLKDILVTL